LAAVTKSDPLVAPTLVAANVMLVAERVTTGIPTPVPLSAMVCGDVAASSVIVTDAVSAPSVVGAKCPWMVQLAPTARLVPQVFAKTNEEAFVPVTAMLAIDNAALPVFVTTTCCDALVSPTVMEPNERLVAENATVVGIPTPVPLNAMVCGEFPALSVMEMVALSAPGAIGAKWPWISHWPPAGSPVPQLFAKSKEEAFGPVRAMPVIDSGASPAFVKTAVCDALVWPTVIEPNDKLVVSKVVIGPGDCSPTVADSLAE